MAETRIQEVGKERYWVRSRKDYEGRIERRGGAGGAGVRRGGAGGPVRRAYYDTR